MEVKTSRKVGKRKKTKQNNLDRATQQIPDENRILGWARTELSALRPTRGTWTRREAPRSISRIPSCQAHFALLKQIQTQPPSLSSCIFAPRGVQPTSAFNQISC